MTVQTRRNKIEKYVFIGAAVVGVVLVGSIMFKLIPSLAGLFGQ